MDKSIETFLSQRKEDRNKKKLKPSMSEQEKLFIEQETEKEFALESWLPNAAKRAGQLSLSSHPAKFTHPSAKAKAIIFKGTYKADGFLHSGNSNVETDCFGNAAAMDVFKFLMMQLDDGKTVLEHLEMRSEKIKEIFSISTASFDELRNGFLAIKKSTAAELTDSKIKQVYFPVSDNYHLLSILSSSGLIYSLRNKIDNLRFSEKTKKARSDMKKQLYNEDGFCDLYNLTIIGYGGTKPQNISVLNNTHGGKAYLLPSFPPTLNNRYLHLPQNDFFYDSLWRKNFNDEFEAFHRIFSTDYNNNRIREGCDRWLQFIIDKVIDKMWVIRSAEPGWSSKDSCKLPLYQKIWLDDARRKEREEDTDWINQTTKYFGLWIIHSYEKIIGKNAKCLDDNYLAHIKKLIEQSTEALK